MKGVVPHLLKEKGVQSVVDRQFCCGSQQELYHVLEREELSKRKQAPPKPYLYQALTEI